MKLSLEQFADYCIKHNLTTELERKIALEMFEIDMEPDLNHLEMVYLSILAEHEDAWQVTENGWTVIVYKTYLQPYDWVPPGEDEPIKIFPKIGRIRVLGTGKNLGADFTISLLSRGGALRWTDSRKSAKRSGNQMTLAEAFLAIPMSDRHRSGAIQEALSFFTIRPDSVRKEETISTKERVDSDKAYEMAAWFASQAKPTYARQCNVLNGLVHECIG